jgi:hypothetical protein
MTDYDIEPGQTWVFDRLRPEDAEGVSRLFRSVYGDDYPIRTFIDPDLLIKENQAQRTVSSVARTPKGDIVGHNAVFHSAPSEKIFESGAGLVHKHYRGGKGIFTGLGIHSRQTALELGAAAIWGEPVTNHIFAQKSTHAVGWITYAVEVDLMPGAAYVKEKSAPGRVSTLMDFEILNSRPHRVFLPRAYENQLRLIYDPLKEHRDLVISTGQPPREPETQIKADYFDFARVARLAVPRIGSDFPFGIDGQEAEMIKQGAAIFQVWLQMTDPAIGWAVEALRSRGWFMGGVLPRWFDDDGLLMQKALSKPSWENINLYYERAKTILGLVRDDWETVSGTNI